VGIPIESINKISSSGFVSLNLFNHPSLASTHKLEQRLREISRAGELTVEHQNLLKLGMKDLIVSVFYQSKSS
jgi:hypothetical protein